MVELIQPADIGGEGSGTVTEIDTSAPLTGGPITTSGTIGITQATTSTDGYLSSTDWNTFNNKQNAGNYALTDLSNLVPITGDIIPSSNGNLKLGNQSNPFQSIGVTAILLTDPTTGNSVNIVPPVGIPGSYELLYPTGNPGFAGNIQVFDASGNSVWEDIATFAAPIYPSQQIVYGDGSTPGGTTNANILVSGNDILLLGGSLDLQDTFAVNFNDQKIFSGTYSGGAFGTAHGLILELGPSVANNFVVENSGGIPIFEINGADGQPAFLFFDSSSGYVSQTGIIMADVNGALTSVSSIPTSFLGDGNGGDVAFWDSSRELSVGVPDFTYDSIARTFTVNNNTPSPSFTMVFSIDNTFGTSKMVEEGPGSGGFMLYGTNSTGSPGGPLGVEIDLFHSRYSFGNTTINNSLIIDDGTFSSQLVTTDSSTFLAKLDTGPAGIGLTYNNLAGTQSVISANATRTLSIITDGTSTTQLSLQPQTGFFGSPVDTAGFYYYGNSSSGNTGSEQGFTIDRSSGGSKQIIGGLTNPSYLLIDTGGDNAHMLVSDGSGTFYNKIDWTNAGVLFSYSNNISNLLDTNTFNLSEGSFAVTLSDGSTYQTNLTLDISAIGMELQNESTGLNGTFNINNSIGTYEISTPNTDIFYQITPDTNLHYAFEDFASSMVTSGTLDITQNTSEMTDGTNFDAKVSLTPTGNTISFTGIGGMFPAGQLDSFVQNGANTTITHIDVASNHTNTFSMDGSQASNSFTNNTTNSNGFWQLADDGGTGNIQLNIGTSDNGATFNNSILLNTAGIVSTYLNVASNISTGINIVDEIITLGLLSGASPTVALATITPNGMRMETSDGATYDMAMSLDSTGSALNWTDTGSTSSGILVNGSGFNLQFSSSSSAATIQFLNSNPDLQVLMTTSSGNFGMLVNNQQVLLGAAIGGNNTAILINDATQTYTFDKLTGTGTRLVTASSTGVLGTTAMTQFTQIVGSADLTARTATVSSVVTTTPTATTTYQISGYADINAISAGALVVTVTYFDENAVSQTLTLVPSGTLNATGDFYFSVATIRAGTGGAITGVATFTGISINYDIGLRIVQM